MVSILLLSRDFEFVWGLRPPHLNIITVDFVSISHWFRFLRPFVVFMTPGVDAPFCGSFYLFVFVCYLFLDFCSLWSVVWSIFTAKKLKWDRKNPIKNRRGNPKRNSKEEIEIESLSNPTFVVWTLCCCQFSEARRLIGIEVAQSSSSEAV